MAFIQSAQINTSGTSAALAYTSNNAAGNLLICAIRRGATIDPTSITDSRGNTWVLARKQTYNGGIDAFWVYHALSCAAGANTLTVTWAASVSIRIAILEYSDFAATGAVLDQVTGAEGFSTTPNSGSVTTTVATELLFSAASVANSFAFTAGASYTEREEVATKIAAEDRNVTATGTYDGTWTLSAIDNWGCALATYMAAENDGPLIGSRASISVPLST